ncbi:hypothetical protein J32TS6_17540 [Virgibacillus pantothenticus]|uniref:hypothetical protein n=1 Tax=Virgibacillus TaxID=84406 RepID=UPI0012EC7A84|nr:MULTISPECIES: hypothetical protein [Virgibacillus]MBS7428050.1 hypothetical protein [Virgibacillus sp. 19R1-5]MBU8567782.1 hypothetical protein [Virgibacillus pantothenticus]MBU8601575.1 hypothetical protein [Virgibacillus pantothenticus]MBU8635804.1 hypothetical protein [Virgibacillus pantothenticus]MBU8643510.1 hypothetical protein [Virgibacillus pantothenticus]
MTKKLVAILAGFLFTIVIVSILVGELLLGSLIGFVISVALVYLFFSTNAEKSRNGT